MGRTGTHGHDGPAGAALRDHRTGRHNSRKPVHARLRASQKLGHAHSTEVVARAGRHHADRRVRRVYWVGLRRRPRGVVGLVRRGASLVGCWKPLMSCDGACASRVWKALMWRTQTRTRRWTTRTPLNQSWTVWWRASPVISRRTSSAREYMTTPTRSDDDSDEQVQLLPRDFEATHIKMRPGRVVAEDASVRGRRGPVAAAAAPDCVVAAYHCQKHGVVFSCWRVREGIKGARWPRMSRKFPFTETHAIAVSCKDMAAAAIGGEGLVDGESVSALYLIDGVGTKEFKLLRLDSAEGDDRDARWALAFAGSSLMAMPCTNACVIFSGEQQWVRERRVGFRRDLYPRAPLCCAVDEHRIACSDGDSVVVLDATSGAFLKEHRTFLEEKRAEEKRPWRITNVGCTHNKISVVLDAAGEGYNDGAAYVFDADGTTVERLGVVPKKKRVVLTDKELFEDDVWLASREKRDDDDEDVPEGHESHDDEEDESSSSEEERQPWRDEFDREFEKAKPAVPKTPEELGVARCGRSAGFVRVEAPLDYYDDDALREGYAEEDVSEEAVIYPSRVIDNDTDADLIKRCVERGAAFTAKTSYSVLLRNASADPDGPGMDDYELDSTVFLEGDEPSRTAWCARHGLVVDGTTTTEDVREIVDRGNVHEITRRRRRALYRRRPRKRAPLSRRRLLRDVPRGVEADETRPASVLRVEAADREAASKAAEAARVAALPWFEREALLAGAGAGRRAPSPPATAAPVSEDVPPGVAAATAAAEAAAAPSAKRPRSDDDGDGDDAKRARVEDPALDPKRLKRLKVEELRAALEGLGCDTEGTKPTLVERLVAARAASAAPEPVEMEAEPSPADAPAAAEPAANADAEIDPKSSSAGASRS